MKASYDHAFANAVRLAATGLRTAAGVDPETKAAPLAAILRSGAALDADGLELLARLVTGDLRKVASRPGETMLAHAVRRARPAWRDGKGKAADPAIAGAALAAMLRNDHARLGPGERALLADLLTGELRRGRNAPPKGAGHPHVVAVVESFRNSIGAGLVRKQALEFTATEFKISESTVARYVEITKEREGVIQRATDI